MVVFEDTAEVLIEFVLVVELEFGREHCLYGRHNQAVS